MPWPLPANSGCSQKFHRKRWHGIHWHTFMLQHTAIECGVEVCAPNHHATQKWLLLGLSLSFTVTSCDFPCQTHSRSFILTENYRGPQSWESHLWLLQRGRSFGLTRCDNPSSHSKQTPVAASSSCTGQALPATGFKCQPLCEQLIQLYNNSRAVINNLVGKGCSRLLQAAHGLQCVGIQ